MGKKSGKMHTHPCGYQVVPGFPVKSAAGPGPAQRHQIPKVGRRVGRTGNHLRRPEAQLGALPGTRQLSIQTDLTGGPQGLDSGLFLVYLEVLGPKFMK